MEEDLEKNVDENGCAVENEVVGHLDNIDNVVIMSGNENMEIGSGSDHDNDNDSDANIDSNNGNGNRNKYKIRHSATKKYNMIMRGKTDECIDLLVETNKKVESIAIG